VKQINLICKKEIEGSRGNILFTTGKSYEANILKDDSIRIKDNTSCFQNIPKKVWKDHFAEESE
jgi:hypothetical protein